jgi:hypothetical protein
VKKENTSVAMLSIPASISVNFLKLESIHYLGVRKKTCKLLRVGCHLLYFMIMKKKIILVGRKTGTGTLANLTDLPCFVEFKEVSLYCNFIT